MNRDTVYVVITTNLIICNRLKHMFIQAMEKPHKLDVSVGRLPQTPTYIGDYFQRDTMQFIISEHMAGFPLRMDPAHPLPAQRIRPPVPDAPLTNQVNIAVIGGAHTGKTAMMLLLESTLLANGIPADQIALHLLDDGVGQRLFSLEEQAECIANMSARKVQILFQNPKKATDVSALMERCGARNTVPQ